VKGRFDSVIQAYLKDLHATQKTGDSESPKDSQTTQQTGGSESKNLNNDWLESFVRNQAPITGKDLCRLRRHAEIQAIRDSGEAHGRAAETKYWDERLEESERRSFNEEAAAMKRFVSIVRFQPFRLW
jgi:hypothetical protein